MKKIMIMLLSILLVASFVACSNDNSGPSGKPVVEPEKANELATTYLNSIDFSKLVVEASREATGLTIKEPAKNGFTVEFKDYKGDALTKNTEAKISSIKSGSIKFEFTTPAAKVTANTYSAETVTPIVFDGADDGVNLSFAITGKATIAYEVIYGSFAGLTADSKVSLSKPEAKDVTLSIGNVPVDFADIEKDVTTGFGVEATVPAAGEEGEGGEAGGDTSFTKDDAATAISDIFNDISRAKLKEDFINGFKNKISGGKIDAVEGVTLVGDISVKYGGKESTALKNYLFAALTGKTQTSLLAEETETNIKNILANIYDATIEMTVEFENYDAFKDQEHDQKDAEHASLITTGKATITICLGRGSIAEESNAVTGLEGTYKVSTSSTDPIVVLTKDNNIYKISLEDFAGSFKLDLTEESKGAELWIPNKDDDSINISIAKGSGTPVSLNWKTDLTDKNKIEADSNFSEKTAEQLDAEYFYQHFGSLRFLNALYAAFNNDNGDAGETYNNLQITGYSKETGITLTEGTSEAKVLTLNIDFGDGYRYYRGSDSYQTVSGKVTFIFTGTVENDKNEFKATGFKVKSDSTLNLSDSSTNSKVSKRPNATATISEEISGNFGEGKEGYITFTLKTGTEDGESVVTGITNYQADESKYNDDTNEFVLTADGGITSIEIELDN